MPACKTEQRLMPHRDLETRLRLWPSSRAGEEELGAAMSQARPPGLRHTQLGRAVPISRLPRDLLLEGKAGKMKAAREICWFPLENTF